MKASAATKHARPIPRPATALLSPDDPVADAVTADPVELASATFNPYAVVVMTWVVPSVVTVVVITLVAVVFSVQLVQLVQGASVPQGPLVHPVQVEGGQADEPHQLVQGPSAQPLLRTPAGPVMVAKADA